MYRRGSKPTWGFSRTVTLRNGRILRAEDYGLKAFPLRNWRRPRWARRRLPMPPPVGARRQPSKQAAPRKPKSKK